MMDLIAVALLVGISLVVLRGGYNIVYSEFLALAIGALLAATLLSTILSMLSLSILETMFGHAVASEAPFVTAVLVALAQPTMTSIGLLATVLIVGFGAAKLHGVTEDLSILLASHKVLVEEMELKNGKKKSQ